MREDEADGGISGRKNDKLGVVEFISELFEAGSQKQCSEQL